MNTLRKRIQVNGCSGALFGVVFLFCVSTATSNTALAQFVDLKAQIEFYNWSTAPAKTLNIHCVVGTNRWQMEGDFCSNCAQTYWFTGKRIIEYSITTKALSNDPLNLGAPIGAEVQRVSESVDGNPGTLAACGPDGKYRNIGPDYLCPLGRIAWLAFCSGPCLKQQGRSIFPPSDLWKELICAPSGFSDSTQVFDDAFGLPKSVNLYTPKAEPVLQYRVVNSTNILGWNFPLEFNMAQYRPAPLPESPGVTVGTNGWELEFTAKGKVTFIGVGTKPQIPSKFVRPEDE